MEKTRIFIILIIILIIIFFSSLVFYFLFQSKNNQSDEQGLNNTQKEEEIKIAQSPLEAIKESFPHISEEKFREYEEMVNTNNFTNCYRDYACVLTSSYLLEDYLFCTRASVHTHSEDEREDEEEHKDEEKKILECSNFVLSKTLPAELSKCYEVGDRQKLLCFQNFIAPYKHIDDCRGISDFTGVEICESVHKYREATETLNISICNNINNDFFREYCFKHSVVN